MVTFTDLRAWRSAKLTEASKDLRSDLKILERAKDDLEDKTLPESWSGLSRLFAGIRQTGLVSSMDEHIEAVRTFEFEIFYQADEVKKIETEVADIDTDAKAAEFSVDGDGYLEDQKKPPTFHSRWEAEEYGTSRHDAAQPLAERITAVFEAAYDVDRALLRARPRSTLGQEVPTDVVDPEVSRDWETMDDEERRKVLERIANRLADQYGIEDFEIRFEDLEDEDGDGTDDNPSTDSHGSWSEDDRVLRIDINDVDDPATISTIAHEVRHAAQHKYVDDYPDLPPGVDPDEVEDWDENFDDYVDPDDDFDGYRDQPVESDAREAGDDYVRDYDGDDLDDDREAVR
ncbi:hypothetical protein [Nocardioides sp. SLBN-35]|uniref:hypothetical protein n=1 Tax=Nocardioides sp. SLBN-35 TaxID=2768445 RepID=UPI00114F97FB|nr:hypothetical protein [Nocardioides sp. SLBN-35]TQK72486.1 hypothetical protein FBY23_4299 [Nocardioides sp. SLBN-35]